jgi:hypothetical protein
MTSKNKQERSMTSTRETTIRETQGENESPGVLAYRVGRLEVAMKDAALAQRENTESHKESTNQLATKMDSLSLNFVPRSDLEGLSREANQIHATLRTDLERATSSVEKRLVAIESNLGWAAKVVLGLVITGVLSVLFGTNLLHK